MELKQQTLLEYLRNEGYSGADARKLLRSGKVKVFGVPTADASRIVNGNDVAIVLNAPRIQVGKEPAIIYRDSTLAVVWKPPRYLSVPAPGRKGEPSVVGFVRRILGEGLPVHRLDEVTSGLMLVALDDTVQKRLKDALAEKTIHRKYLAIVAGKVMEPFEVKNTLFRDRGDGLRGSVDEDLQGEMEGKLAATSFRPIEYLGDATLIEATLDTGRTHQVRIHLSEEGYPVLGEHLYAAQRITSRAPRLCLHAHRLKFAHPSSGDTLTFRAPLADDLEAVRRRLLDYASKRTNNLKARKKRKNKKSKKKRA